MHIPDGYIGPQTYLPAYAAMVPLWSIALRKLKKTLRHRQVPLLALGAAFSFVIMMFNVPILGGSTGHAAGGVLIAVLLGPWAAMVAVSLALIVQALLFGDGGITAIGANCFNIGVVMPFAGWAVYRLAAGSTPAKSSRHAWGAALGGYVGLNAAAITTAIMFGIQPLIARGVDGRSLYCPFGLKVAVPAMALEHLLLFGFVEAVVTGLVIGYIQRTEPGLIPAKASIEPASRSAGLRKVAIGLGILIMLTPLGLYLPTVFGAESAWGEWGSEELHEIAGYVPQGLEKLGSLWRAPVPDYALPGQESASLGALSVTYILSGIIGVAVVVAAVMLLRRAVARTEKDESTP